MKIQKKYTEQPIGRILSISGKYCLSMLNLKLSNLDIDRNYYPLLLIENGEGKLTQQELADLLDTDKASVVRIIDYLSEKGYVKRVNNPTDKRKYCLVMTAKGSKALPPIKQAMLEVTDLAFLGLKPSQIKKFYKYLKIINTNLMKSEESN